MNLVESVYDISESFMDKAEIVYMNIDKIEETAVAMIDHGKPNFPMPDVKDNFQGVLQELVAASINYCYWYGRHDVRPQGSSSTMMYELLQNAFFNYKYDLQKYGWFEECINQFIELLSIRRFPLIEERGRHLRQLIEFGEEFSFAINENHEHIEPHMNNLISTFPGFASDTFLKRASLFFIQLYRRFGWFESDLHNLHVPADYQVPKMLNHFGCLIYEDGLEYAITTNELIPKHSQAECEIRAATVLTIKQLCGITGWNVAEVDGFFFTKRHDVTGPFHLCITTDY